MDDPSSADRSSTGPSSSEVPHGIDADAVAAWLCERQPSLVPPLRFALIAGGHSNLTYRVEDTAGQALALRRPPLGPVLATAHDMAREHRIIEALGPTPVPVPAAMGLCEDESVNGAPFYVMELVEGTVVRDLPGAEALTPTQRRTASEDLVDVLAEIHAVDVDAVGLGDLARREGYIARQLKRWRQQFDASKTRDIPEIAQVHDVLVARIPEQGPAGIVHGDYRLDNVILDRGGHIRAVLDWELCTLGDVLADVGQLLVYWSDPGETAHALASPPTVLEGFLTRDEVARRYAARSGRDLSELDFYLAFSAWKVACILEGVHARYRAGAMGERAGDVDLASFTDRVQHLARRAAEVASRL